jgi:hypothetical protein
MSRRTPRTIPITVRLSPEEVATLDELKHLAKVCGWLRLRSRADALHATFLFGYPPVRTSILQWDTRKRGTEDAPPPDQG